ncbi:hypothetical protein BKA62DRAFT_827043 [Auriculariales sp. MPI-PUGE-AT-0066]|nr:hypothetical protein BKA62DRAFT_827043 [Auriculariales sp. MPI-PUGE-AT-0066]
MRSLAARLLRALSDSGESPPDFLCPCQDSTSALTPDDSTPGPSRLRLDRRADVGTFPRQYVRGEDGQYSINPTFAYHGQSVICTVTTASARPTAGVDFASNNGDSAYSSDPPDTVDLAASASPSPTTSATIPDKSTLPVGWDGASNKYPQTHVVVASTILASFIAALLFGVLFWRSPLNKKRRRKQLPGSASNDAADSDSDLSSIDVEKAADVRDEHPTIRKAVRAQRKALARSLARWKAKARGKASHSIRDIQQRGARTASITSLEDSVIQPPTRPRPSSSRRSSISDRRRDDSTRDHSGSSSVSLPVQTLASSDTSLQQQLPLDSESVSALPTVGASDGPRLETSPAPITSERTVPPALALSTTTISEKQASLSSAVVVPAATTTTEFAPRAETIGAADDAADLLSPIEIHLRGPVDSPPPPLHGATIPEDSSSHPFALTAAPRPYMHIATDDKSILADMASRGSAPDAGSSPAGHQSASGRGPVLPRLVVQEEATAPAWDDDDDDGGGGVPPELDAQLGGDGEVACPSGVRLPPSPATTSAPSPRSPGFSLLHPLLPQPPRRIPSRSLGLGARFDTFSVVGYPSVPPTDLASYPSAPPPLDATTTTSFPSAPPLLDVALSGVAATVPSAPSEDDELQDALLAQQPLPRYER